MDATHDARDAGEVVDLAARRAAMGTSSTKPCGRCGAVATERIESLALCGDCHRHVMKFPVPRWVRAFFVALGLVFLLSLVVQARFARGYFEIKSGFAAMRQNNVDRAAARFDAAARHVPESSEAATLSAYADGIQLLDQEREREALQRFDTISSLPESYGVETYKMEAMAGIAFDDKDYDRFLELSERLASSKPRPRGVLAQVASALACKYAATGDPSFRDKALQKLEEARAEGPTGAEFADYEGRIRYRLDSREIIDAAEFRRRFPHGVAPAQGGGSP